MTVDKFGRNLTHPYHLAKKLKKDKNALKEPVVQEGKPGELFAYLHIMLYGESGVTRSVLVNGRFEYGFPLKSGTIEYVSLYPRNVKTTINAVQFAASDSLIHRQLNFGDKIAFLAPQPRNKVSVEFVIKYPLM